MQNNNEKQMQILEKIEERLRRIERDLKTSSEDQLFFALVFPLSVLFITLPVDSLRIFFQEATKLAPETANTVAQTILYVGFSCLLLSSVIRYYAAIAGKIRSSKTARVISIELLIMAWNGVLFVLVVSLILNAAFLGFFKIPIAAFTSLLIFLCMVWIENKVLSFYASRFLIFKKDVTPIVSHLFARLALALYIGFLTVYVLTLVVASSSEQAIVVFLVAWFATFAVLYIVYFIRLKKRR